NHNMPIVQPGRYGDIMHTRVKNAAASGVDEDFMRKILSTIHEESVRLQVALTENK
ncbi:MAG: chorismate mutase, partial [Duncaniella sp.]|nr:chorismate mutase [Duncaniella sp.]